MKNLRYIVVLLLACVVFVLGTGAGVVHICSVYCKTQVCSSSSHTHVHSHRHVHDGGGCCHNRVDDSPESGCQVAEHCSCLNVEYNFDYILKISQEDDVLPLEMMAVDLPHYTEYNFQASESCLLTSQAPNAPPMDCGGRALLALYSVLII